MRDKFINKWKKYFDYTYESSILLGEFEKELDMLISSGVREYSILLYFCDYDESIDIRLPFRVSRGDSFNISSFLVESDMGRLSKEAYDDFTSGVSLYCSSIVWENGVGGIYQRVNLVRDSDF